MKQINIPEVCDLVDLFMKIFKQNQYKSYRIIINENTIELRFTPKSDNENEINWCIDNTYEDIERVYHSLQTILN